MKVGIIFISFISTVMAVTETLVAIDTGTGVSFIDLWNLAGYSVGSVSDSVYRNGMMDNGFEANCPSKIYFRLLSPLYAVTYHGTYIGNTSLSSILQATPFFVQHNAPLSDTKFELTPDNDVIFKISSYSDPNKIYLAVYLPTNAAPYPQYYNILDEHPIDGPIPAKAADFSQPTRLEIKGKFEDSANCHLHDHSDSKTLAEALTEIDRIRQPQTTTTSTTEDTTTKETTTEAATTTTTTEATTTTTATTEATTTTETTTPSTTRTTENTSGTGTAASTTDTSTTGITTSGQTTPGTNTSQAMCPCDCDFKSRLETISAKSDIPVEELKVILAPVIKEIKKNLTVDETKLSSSIRKKQSATDSRKSAEQVGVIGAVLLAFTFGLLLLMDITSLPRHFKMIKQNFC